MRSLAALVLVAALCQGCFVFEEIDKGQALMDQHGGQGNAKAKEEPEPAPEQEGPGVFARLAKWWSARREAQPTGPVRDPSDGVVRCEIDGNLHFTYRSDCRIRNGRVI